MLKAVAICGHICSGKSSFINHVSSLHEWNVISFGKYIRHLASIKGVSLTRANYQALGHETLLERGPDCFLSDVIQFNQPLSNIHLYDGIRHTSIIEALQRIYQNTLVIYLNACDDQRYHRFIGRASHDDPSLTYGEFLKLSEHPIEYGISAISTIADCVIDTNLSFFQNTNKIEEVLLTNKFTSL